jgi:hypothetical protein
MFRDQRIGFADSLPAYFFPGTTSSAGCDGVPDEVCAARAALNADGTVAWIAAPPGFVVGSSGNSMVGSDHQTHETLESTDGVVIRLDSGAPAGPHELCRVGRCVHARAVRALHRAVIVHWGTTDGTGTVSVATWTHGGTRFSLSAADPDGSVDLAWFTKVLRSIR